MANRMPVYSVLKPPTSSCSASTRSNGGWFVSAVAQIGKMPNGTSARTQYQSAMNEPGPSHVCCTAIWCVESVWACTSTPRIASPNAASYESSCAVDRTAPSKGYFDPDDQPA